MKKEIAKNDGLTENQLEILAKIREREASISPLRIKESDSNMGSPAAKTKEELTIQNFCSLGISDEKCVLSLIHQLVMAHPSLTQENGISLINHNSILLSEIGPKTGLEGMLAMQMVGVHNLCMEAMSKAAIKNSSVEALNSATNRVTKLTRTFVAQIEALTRHRNKGKQKMTIEHVHVNSGGQAIIGAVQQGGGGGQE